MPVFQLVSEQASCSVFLGEILGKILSGYRQVRNTEKMFGLGEVHIS
jgi:hypothetical protein